ncbi:hypothetical protein C0Q70_12352 [Pomacea canaliculata]|uniref:Uncharacterized protein n=1 Tax=Pomacea canaliculata TaxID=400727 RepID=A0A2T7P194_POMCA|nr:hypothetical protein C0Q70_12352 [Pomacea canaliculata]
MSVAVANIVAEIVAVLNYDKSYSCHPTNGYTCTKTTDVTFNITLGCETLQNVTLVGDGQQPVTCIPMESSPVESTNINNHNCSACANDTAPGNSVSHSRRKRCACPNGLPGPSADTGKPGNTGGEGGISNGHEQNESRFPIGHSIIILILIMNAVTGVVFLSLKQTKLCKSWKQNRKRRAKERTRLSKLEDTVKTKSPYLEYCLSEKKKDKGDRV